MDEHYLRVLHCLANCLEELNKGKVIPADHYLKIAIWDIESIQKIMKEVHGEQNYSFLCKNNIELHESLCIARTRLSEPDAPSPQALRMLKKAYGLIGKEVFNAS